jgi:hypothetical protein
MGRLPHAPVTRRTPSSFVRVAALLAGALSANWSVDRKGPDMAKSMHVHSGTMIATAGERFARALAAKDSTALCALLADRIDFQALTPGRHWQAAAPREVVEEIILGHWFGAGDHIQELRSVTAGQVSEREHVAYRLRVRRSGVDYLVEQQAYYNTDGARITWLRMLCSGYQALRDDRPAAR